MGFKDVPTSECLPKEEGFATHDHFASRTKANQSMTLNKRYLNNISVFEINDGKIICVDSTDSEGVSLTNAAEKVCDYISRMHPDHKYEHIIYKDTEGAIDELMVGQQFRFRGFRILNAKSFKEGASKAMQLKKERGAKEERENAKRNN